MVVVRRHSWIRGMWKQFSEALTPDREFGPPALWAEVTLAGEKLGIKFPDDLRNLLFETNGVHGQYGLGLIWPLERIVADNTRFRANEHFKDLYIRCPMLGRLAASTPPRRRFR